MEKTDNKTLLIFGIIVIFLVLAICCLVGPTSPIIKMLIPFTNQDMAAIHNIYQIEIYGIDENNARPLLKTIDDPDEINKVVEQFQAYAHGWQKIGFSQYFVLRSPVHVYFYPNAQTTASVSFYIGRKKNGTPYIADWYDGKNLTEEEFKTLVKVLGIDEELADP